MSDWHYSDNGGKFGPVTIDELKAMFRNGGVTSETLVWTGDFGPTWKKYSEVPDLHDGNGPPPLPTSAIGDGWLWALALVPLAGYFIERVVTESYGAVSAPMTMLAYGAVNTALGYQDEQAIKTSGRNANATTFWAALVFVPLYLFARNKRLGRNQIPLAVWVASVAFSMYAAAGFAMPYLGLTAPVCTSGASMEKVKELFPQLPLNVMNLGVSEVKNISTVSSSGKKTECAGDVVTSNGSIVPVAYTIEERDDGYYYWLNLKF